MLNKMPGTGSLVKTSAMSGVSKIKTAEVRHLNSPQKSPKLKGSCYFLKFQEIFFVLMTFKL